jgi:hypothetical protein
MECAGSLDVLRLRKLITPERYDRGIQLLEAEVAMLTKMIRSCPDHAYDNGLVQVHVADAVYDHVNVNVNVDELGHRF